MIWAIVVPHDEVSPNWTGWQNDSAFWIYSAATFISSVKFSEPIPASWPEWTLWTVMSLPIALGFFLHGSYNNDVFNWCCCTEPTWLMSCTIQMLVVWTNPSAMALIIDSKLDIDLSILTTNAVFRGKPRVYTMNLHSELLTVKTTHSVNVKEHSML